MQLVWPEERAVVVLQINRLHLAVSRMRAAGFKPRIVARPGGYALDACTLIVRRTGRVV